MYKPGSVVSTVSGYGLDDRAIDVRSPTGAKEFSSSLCVQTGSGATQSPVKWVPGVLSLELKRGRGVTLTTHPHLVPRSSRMYILYFITGSTDTICMFQYC
jgi:hypothetical protein